MLKKNILIKQEGINFKKFFLYITLSSFLFILSSYILYFLNDKLLINIQISNFIADFIALLITYFVSKEIIFLQNDKKKFLKISVFFSLRTISITVFSIATPLFFFVANWLISYVNLDFDTITVYFFTKSLMIPFSLFINFLITFYSIEYIENHFKGSI